MKDPTAIAGPEEAFSLIGNKIPGIVIDSTDEEQPIGLSGYLGDHAVLFFYPATGVPGRDPTLDPAPGWDDIPGAAGCTAESCPFEI